jgi:chromosome segregation ATPase
MQIDEIKAELTQIENKLAQAEELLRPSKERLKEIQKQLRESCPDDCESAYVKEDYIPGTYLDSAYSTYHRVCDVCGKYKQIKYQSHGRYG